MVELKPEYNELLVRVKLEDDSIRIVLKQAAKYVSRWCEGQYRWDEVSTPEKLYSYLMHDGSEELHFSRPIENAGQLIIDPVNRTVRYVTGLGKGEVTFQVPTRMFVFRGTIGSWTGGWSEFIKWNNLYGLIEEWKYTPRGSEGKPQRIRIARHKFKFRRRVSYQRA